MVRRLCIILTDMNSCSNLCLCASGSQGGSEDLPHQSADQGEEHHPVLLLCLQYQAPLSIPPLRQVKDTAMSPPAQISAQTSPTCLPAIKQMQSTRTFLTYNRKACLLFHLTGGPVLDHGQQGGLLTLGCRRVGMNLNF